MGSVLTHTNIWREEKPELRLSDTSDVFEYLNH